MKQRKKGILIISFFLIIQCLIYILAGSQKSYIHMDEAYSLGLASYDKVEIQDSEDFYDQWHSGEYYEDYLSLQEEEKGSFRQVYENQKNDVHPPLYYLFLRLGMEFDGGHYNKWPGIVINIFIYLFITVFMYLISKKVLEGQENKDTKAIIVAFASSVTMAAVTNAIYIRMYALLNLFIVLTAFLHIKLYENDKSLKTMIIIGITALLGSLTHYYYIFFLVATFMLFCTRYFKNKDYKSLGKYVGITAVAGGLSLLIFPYSIQHMFFGYRGKGFIEKLLDFKTFFISIGQYLYIIHKFVFNYMLPLVLVALAAIYMKRKGKKTKASSKSELLKILYVPAIFYFLIVSVASPWQELRYIMPIGGIVFLIVIYYLYIWIKTVMSEKNCNITFAILLAVTLVSPAVTKLEPQVAFTDKKEIVQKLENDLNVPTLYAFDSSHNRFLDDILLFSKLDESYVAKDIEYTEENIQSIFHGKDTSNGVVVFINGKNADKNNDILETVKTSLSLTECRHLKRMNACDVFYIK